MKPLLLAVNDGHMFMSDFGKDVNFDVEPLVGTLASLRPGQRRAQARHDISSSRGGRFVALRANDQSNAEA
jgi:hypothetical protein